MIPSPAWAPGRAQGDETRGERLFNRQCKEYLEDDPKSRVSGTKMVYIGLKQEAQQLDMIAFLEKATQ